MSMDLEHLFWMFSFLMPLAIELSVFIVVTGCSWPISSREWKRGMGAFESPNRAPIYAFADDANMFSRFCKG